MEKGLRNEIVEIALPIIQRYIKSGNYSQTKILAHFENILERYFHTEYFEEDINNNPDLD